MINNLSQLKKHFATLPEFEVVAHCRPECIGEKRKVNVCNTQGIYSVIPDDSNAKATLANRGMGSWLAWSKSSFWKFENNIASVYTSDKVFNDNTLVLSMKLI